MCHLLQLWSSSKTWNLSLISSPLPLINNIGLKVFMSAFKWIVRPEWGGRRQIKIFIQMCPGIVSYFTPTIAGFGQIDQFFEFIFKMSDICIFIIHILKVKFGTINFKKIFVIINTIKDDVIFIPNSIASQFA